MWPTGSTTTHRGKGMIIITMNSIHILEEVKILTMITTNFVERFNEEVIYQRRHLAKGMMTRKVIGTTDMTQDQILSCCVSKTI